MTPTYRVLFSASVASVLLLNSFSSASAQMQGDVDPNSASPIACVNLSTNLRYQDTDSSTSGAVSKLQEFLIQRGFMRSEATGYFGSVTFASVKAYQSSVGLTNSGYVGDYTRAAIRQDSCGSAGATTNTTSTGGTSSGAQTSNRTPIGLITTGSSGSGCTVLVGRSSCSVTVQWTTSEYAESPLPELVTCDTTNGSCNEEHYSGKTGYKTFTVQVGGRRSASLWGYTASGSRYKTDELSLNATCDTGLYWNGSICTTNPTGAVTTTPGSPSTPSPTSSFLTAVGSPNSLTVTFTAKDGTGFCTDHFVLSSIPDPAPAQAVASVMGSMEFIGNNTTNNNTQVACNGQTLTYTFPAAGKYRVVLSSLKQKCTVDTHGNMSCGLDPSNPTGTVTVTVPGGATSGTATSVPGSGTFTGTGIPAGTYAWRIFTGKGDRAPEEFGYATPSIPCSVTTAGKVWYVGLNPQTIPGVITQGELNAVCSNGINVTTAGHGGAYNYPFGFNTTLNDSAAVEQQASRLWVIWGGNRVGPQWVGATTWRQPTTACDGNRQNMFTTYNADITWYLGQDSTGPVVAVCSPTYRLSGPVPLASSTLNYSGTAVSQKNIPVTVLTAETAPNSLTVKFTANDGTGFCTDHWGIVYLGLADKIGRDVTERMDFIGSNSTSDTEKVPCNGQTKTYTFPSMGTYEVHTLSLGVDCASYRVGVIGCQQNPGGNARITVTVPGSAQSKGTADGCVDFGPTAGICPTTSSSGTSAASNTTTSSTYVWYVIIPLLSGDTRQMTKYSAPALGYNVPPVTCDASNYGKTYYLGTGNMDHVALCMKSDDPIPSQPTMITSATLNRPTTPTTTTIGGVSVNVSRTPNGPWSTSFSLSGSPTLYAVFWGAQKGVKVCYVLPGNNSDMCTRNTNYYTSIVDTDFTTGGAITNMPSTGLPTGTYQVYTAYPSQTGIFAGSITVTP